MADPWFSAKLKQMQAKEERFLQAERSDPDSPYSSPLLPRAALAGAVPSRRRFVLGAAGALGAGALARGAAAAAPPGAVERDVAADPSKVMGVATGEDGGYGTRSQFETEVRTRFKTATRAVLVDDDAARRRAWASSRRRACISSAATAAPR